MRQIAWSSYANHSAVRPADFGSILCYSATPPTYLATLDTMNGTTSCQGALLKLPCNPGPSVASCYGFFRCLTANPTTRSRLHPKQSFAGISLVETSRRRLSARGNIAGKPLFQALRGRWQQPRIRRSPWAGWVGAFPTRW